MHSSEPLAHLVSRLIMGTANWMFRPSRSATDATVSGKKYMSKKL